MFEWLFIVRVACGLVEISLFLLKKVVKLGESKVKLII